MTYPHLKENLSVEIMDHIDQQKLILEHLKKAIAQAQLTLSDDFLDYSSETIHYYLSALCDNLEFIRNMVESLIKKFPIN
ncbi:hypothetical protein [Rickettsiella massiliensis]|uniref:hypothetical protein n=1 Tax=Rickettsiella massiliensis TaxID=676517 RepID=UPI00029AFF3B|nr:hypothetical protein [Rickettsiella massiliensis]